MSEPAHPPAAWSRRNVLDLEDFSRDEIETVMETTDAMQEILGREIRRVPTLRGTAVVTLFYEASTRTRASFELAGKVLGADVINLSASGSSVEKGESLVDTVRTLQAIGADVVVMRLAVPAALGAPHHRLRVRLGLDQALAVLAGLVGTQPADLRQQPRVHAQTSL